MRELFSNSETEHLDKVRERALDLYRIVRSEVSSKCSPEANKALFSMWVLFDDNMYWAAEADYGNKKDTKGV